MIKNKLYLIPIIVSLSLCEGGTTFTKTIDNKSSETISIKLHSVYGKNEFVTINGNTSKNIFWADQMGFFPDNTYTCTDMIDTVEVIIANNKILTKDFMDSNNWDKKSKKGRNSRKDCTFIITDNDIQ